MGWLQAGIGALGALDAFNRNRGARGYEQAAAADLNATAAIKRKLLGLADSYDPAAETRASVDYARDTAEMGSRQALARLNADFRKYGGQPGGDTNFQYNTNAEMRRVFDPLKSFAAQERSQETARKAALYQTALSSGGDVTGRYMALSGQARTNPGPSLELFAGGVDALNLFNKGSDALSPSRGVQQASRRLVDRMRLGDQAKDPANYQNDPYQRYYA